MDGFNTFKSLCDAIPEWQERLAVLTKEATDRHAEFLRLARSTAVPPLPASLRRNKTGSMESLRPEEDVKSGSPATGAENKEGDEGEERSSKRRQLSPPAEPVRVDINPESKRLFQDYRLQAKRKRATPSMLSTPSGRRPARVRTAVVVYYDSSIQDHFGWLVRTVAGARNGLRKGKTAASMRARLAGMGMEESPFRGEHAAGFSVRDPKIPRLAPAGAESDASAAAYSPLPFDTIDKELEAAQSLCEIGAHQFLREGTCADEISGTLERFNAVLKMAGEQRDLYEPEAKLEEEQRKKHAESQQATPSPPRTRNRINAASAAVERMLAAAGPRGIEIDPDALRAPMVDPTALTVDPAVAGGIAVDDDFAMPRGIAVDESYGGPDPMPLPGSIAVDRNFSGSALIALETSLAVDPNHPVASPGAIAVDENFAGDTLAPDKVFAVNSIAVDESFGSNTIEVDKSNSPKGIAVDQDFAPGAIEVDQDFAGDFVGDFIAVDRDYGSNGIAVDRDYGSNGITVDHDYSPTGIAIDDVFKSKAHDLHMASGTPSPVQVYRYSAGPIEIDEEDDNSSFHIDMSAFRRTNRT